MRKILFAVLVAFLLVPVVVNDLPAPAPQPPRLAAYVRKANPSLPTPEVHRIAFLVESTARRYGLDVGLFAAIVRTESTFKPGLKVCYTNEGVRRSCDYGLGQVNSLWIDEFNLDAHRLQHDEEYNLNVAARILKKVIGKRRASAAYSLYHHSDPERRAEYEARVESVRVRHL